MRGARNTRGRRGRGPYWDRGRGGSGGNGPQSEADDYGFEGSMGPNGDMPPFMGGGFNMGMMDPGMMMMGPNSMVGLGMMGEGGMMAGDMDNPDGLRPSDMMGAMNPMAALLPGMPGLDMRGPGMGMGMGMGFDPFNPLSSAMGAAVASGPMGPMTRMRELAPHTPPGGPPAGPRDKQVNDYCQHFVDTGQRPQNFLRDSLVADRYEEYPKLKELVARKDEIVAENATPPYYLKADLKHLNLSVDTLGCKFDVVLVDPPWEEYVRRAPGLLHDTEVWSWEEIAALDVGAIADTPSFLFLWCGTEEGLDAGRHILNRWGFRRVEDICWIKANTDPNRKYLSAINQLPTSILTHTKEHCLMGMKGNVRRNQDGHVIHANCDTDVIVGEEPALGSCQKPEELYQLIERFCLGKRRLELFGEDHNIRQGWVTIGRSLSGSNFNPQTYQNHFLNPDGTPYIHHGFRIQHGAPNLVPSTPEIESLRPKSPPQR